MVRLAPRILAAAALIWVAILIVTPVGLAHGYVALPAIVYEAAGLICHQRPERSFHLHGIQLPVCARCFGLYASGAIGAVVACITAGRWAGRAQAQNTRRGLVIAAVPTAVTVGCEWFGIWYPGGAMRAIAAIPLGAVAGWVVVTGLASGAAAPRPSQQVRYHS